LRADDALRRLGQGHGHGVDHGTFEIVIGDLAAELGIRASSSSRPRPTSAAKCVVRRGCKTPIRLKTDMIDVMLVHSIVNVATELPVMREWQQAGRFKYIGASISTLDQFEQMEQFMRDNEVRSCSSTIRSAIAPPRSACCRSRPIAASA
jgi:hypothetical protein